MKHFINNRYAKCLTAAALGCLLSTGTALAQQAGQIISGHVYDTMGPVMMANVVEIDAAGRIVAACTTDFNGNFSFKLKNPKNKLRVSFVGYKTQTLPINKTSYRINLVDATQIKEVVVKAKKRAQGSGLAIPEREISTSRQTISTKEFEGLAITTIDEALQGRIAGLDIVANSGNLGAGTSMRLRGVSSLTGNAEPLIVVDGNVFEKDQSQTIDVSSMNDEKFAELLNVNPDDIESISVLKDAAATAIWGSQGANGVIEIKTKRGARGKTKVTYSLRVTATHQPEGMKMLNGDEYTMLMKEEFFNQNLSDAASDIKELNYLNPIEFSEARMFDDNTDWVDAVKQTGWRQNHYVSISGGGEKANFRIGAGYDHETGSIIKQVLDRFTTRVALDYFVSSRIKFESNLSFTYTKNQKNYSDLLGIAYKRMPNLSIYEEDEYGNDTDRFYNIQSGYSPVLKDQYNLDNPVALAHLAKNHQSTYKIQPEFKINYKLLGTDDEHTRLDYEGKIMFDINNEYNDKFRPSSINNGGWYEGNNNTGSFPNHATSSSSKSLGISTTHTMTFTPHFKNTDHSLMMMLRGQVNSGNSNYQTTAVYRLPSGTIDNPSASAPIKDMSTSSGQWRSIYLTYSAHYAYKGRYMLDFSVRRDGSTKFGPDQRWGNFPAVSVKWILSDEPWFKKMLPFVSMLAVRPGWGVVGKQPGNEYLFLSRYGNGTGYLGTGGTKPNNIQLKNLKWEEKETLNLGIDFGFFNEKITGNVEVYKQTTSDLLIEKWGIPTSSGYSSLNWYNGGKMDNIGWEFNINGNQIVKAGKFSMDFNVTFANNQNKLKEMDGTYLSSLNKEWSGGNGNYMTRIELNRPMGSIYGFRYKGVYQYTEWSEEEVKKVSGPNAPVAHDKNGNVIFDHRGRPIPMTFRYGKVDYEFKGGDAIYEDINHDGTIDELDIVYLGSSLPKITGGFGFKVHIGRLTWNNQFNFRYGNKIINAARLNAESMNNVNNQSRAVNWRWRVEGQADAKIPRAVYGSQNYNALGSDRFVEDGSFVRLNYSQISYSFPSKLVKKWGLSGLRIDISGNNLFCLTEYSGADPEVGYGGWGVTTDNAQTPRSRSFTAGINVQF